MIRKSSNHAVDSPDLWACDPLRIGARGSGEKKEHKAATAVVAEISIFPWALRPKELRAVFLQSTISLRANMSAPITQSRLDNIDLVTVSDGDGSGDSTTQDSVYWLLILLMGQLSLSPPMVPFFAILPPTYMRTGYLTAPFNSGMSITKTGFRQSLAGDLSDATKGESLFSMIYRKESTGTAISAGRRADRVQLTLAHSTPQYPQLVQHDSYTLTGIQDNDVIVVKTLKTLRRYEDIHHEFDYDADVLACYEICTINTKREPAQMVHHKNLMLRKSKFDESRRLIKECGPSAVKIA